jgi:ribosomal 30S subunit maturation factor RimM
MAFKEETSVHPVSPPKPPGVAETIEYEIAASDLVELAHAKHRLKALSARNTELAALCDARAAEQEDQYYALQRRLDDNYLRITELERKDLK